MTREEVRKTLVAIISEKLGKDEKDITDNSTFTTDLGADSLDVVELIMEMEKAFNISIPDDDAEKISTVGDAINYIMSKIQNKTSQ